MLGRNGFFILDQGGREWKKQLDLSSLIDYRERLRESSLESSLKAPIENYRLFKCRERKKGLMLRVLHERRKRS